jgi:hypothetical protein
MHLVIHLDLLVRFFNPLYALRAVFLTPPFFVDVPLSRFILRPHALASLLPFFILIRCPKAST